MGEGHGYSARAVGPRADPNEKYPPLHKNAMFAIADFLRPEILKNQPDPLELALDVTGQTTLCVSLRRPGQTAAFGTWLRNASVYKGRIKNGDIVSASLYLSGISAEADGQAIRMAQDFRDAAGNGIQVKDTVFPEIETMPKPLGILFNFNVRSAGDPLVLAAFHGLGFAFFGVLGALETEDPGD